MIGERRRMKRKMELRKVGSRHGGLVCIQKSR